jgi:hypothetical protein
MIYYQYIKSYTNAQGMTARVTLTRSVEDVDYPSHLEESKTIADQQIFVNDGELPAVFNEVINTLTLAQYNAIVKGPDDLEIDPDIILPEE